jgi:hypothetical protein
VVGIRWIEEMKISIKRMKQIIQEEVSSHLQKTGELYSFSENSLLEIIEEERAEDSQLTDKEAEDAIDDEIATDGVGLEEKMTDEDQLIDPKTKKVIKVKVQNKK